MLNHIQQPEYRQLIVELLSVISTILSRNPELIFSQPLDLKQLIEDAAQMYAKVGIAVARKSTIFFKMLLSFSRITI